MFRPPGPPPTSRPATGRRGAILIVVLALLALFLVIALTFVFYADNEATTARIYREGQDNNGAATASDGAPDPTLTVSQLLVNLLYDTTDTNPADLVNALRGHSLTATMYGRVPGGGMYNGVGTFHDTVNQNPMPPPAAGGPPSQPFGTSSIPALTDRGLVVNYSNIPVAMNVGGTPKTFDFIFDPEWTGGYRLTGNQPAPTLSNPTFSPPNTPGAQARSYLPKNAPYTYPDLNNFFLAAMSPVTGEVLAPSFFRPWHFNQANSFGQGGTNSTKSWTRLAPWDPSGTVAGSNLNVDWITVDGRAKILRPRPIDQLTPSEITGAGLPFPLPADPTTLTATQQTALFNLLSGPTGLITTEQVIPYPPVNADGSFTGDVQNLVGGVGVAKNDSILLDIGCQSVQWKVNGKVTWIKPLVAVLIRDLDPLINLNAAGNIKNGGVHASYAGYGPWEINMAWGMQNNATEASTIVGKRYGPAGAPVSLTGVTSMPNDRSVGALFGQYAQINWDATGAPGAPPIQVPGFGATPNPFQVDPIYGPGSAGFWDNNATASKAQNHPSLYNPGDWAPLPSTWAPNAATTPFSYPLSDLRRLSLKYADTLFNYSETTLWRLAPQPTDIVGSLGFANNPKMYRTDPAHATRTLFTPLSTGFELPRFPGNFNVVQTTNAALQLGTTYPYQLMFANAATSPAPYPGSFPTPGSAGGVLGGFTDFGTNDVRHQRVGLGPVDLNRPLSDYRDLVNPNNPTPNGNPNFPGGTFNPVAPGPNNMGNYTQAWADRHNLARDIFARLIMATGALAFVDPYSGNVILPQNNAGTYTLTPPSYTVLVTGGSGGTFSLTVNTTSTGPIPVGASAFQVQSALLAASPGPVFVTAVPNSGGIQYTVTFYNTSSSIQPPTPGLTGAGAGATAAVSPVSLSVTATEYNALRYLAQLAANAVDYIDKDDVNTAFIWNPVNATPPALTATTNPYGFQATPMGVSFSIPNQMVFGAEKPKLVINEVYSEIANDPTEPSAPTGMTTTPGKLPRVRFWVELLNPTNTPYPSGSGGPQGDGRAQLRYETGGGPTGDGVATAFNPYKLVVSRFSKSGTNVLGTAVNVPTYLADPTNPAGDLPINATTPPADIDYDFSNYSGGAYTPTASRIVMPNNGVYAPGGPTQGIVVAGPTIPAPTMGQGPQSFEFSPPTAAAPWNTMILSQQPPTTAVGTAPPLAATVPAMEYLLPGATVPSTGTTQGQTPPQLNSQDLQEHVVLLRRLANPYLQPNDPSITTGPFAFNASNPINPYVTVDYMDWVPTFDAMNWTQDQPPPRSPGGGAKAVAGGVPQSPGYDPMGYRFSVGKVQPYAGLSYQAFPTSTNTLPNTVYSFPTSFVLAQSPSGFNQGTSGVPATTFGRHNGTTVTGPAPPSTTVVAPSPGPPVVNTALTATGLTGGTPETIMAPFDWFVHFDRPLTNQLELLSLQAGKPHEVTQLFVRPPVAAGAGQPVRKNVGLVPWLGVNPATNLPGFDTANNATHNGLYRSLDLLRVKPWGYGEALGGRVFGRMNINTIQDPRLLSAILDPQGGNVFNAGDVSNLWTSLFTSPVGGTSLQARTPITNGKQLANGTPVVVPVPGPTFDDLQTAGMAFAPAATSGYMAPTDRPFKPFGSPEFSSGGMVASNGSGLQDTLLRVNPAGIPLATVGSQTHPYMQAELLRKMLNNVTTVSNAFEVTVTVVYHKVRVDASGNKLTDGSAAAPRELLGPEAYQQTPGDMRQQFFAVIDRSNLAVAGGNMVSRPFYAAVDQPAFPGAGTSLFLSNAIFKVANPLSSSTLTVMADGQPAITIATGTPLLVGTGANQESVTVQGFNSNGSMIVNLAKAHGTGEVVTTSAPGIPGSNGSSPTPPAVPPLPNPSTAPTFDLWKNGVYNNSSPYKWVIPYLSQVK